MHIYLACALTHVSRERFGEHSAFIHAIAGALHSQGHTVRYALVDSDPQLASKPVEDRARLCYLWDRRMVEEADLVVAEASFPSIGLGIELQIAEDRGTPIILVYSTEAGLKAADVQYTNPDKSEHHLQLGEGYVSLMALGLPNVVRSIGYQDRDTALKSIIRAVEDIDPKHTS